MEEIEKMYTKLNFIGWTETSAKVRIIEETFCCRNEFFLPLSVSVGDTLIIS